MLISTNAIVLKTIPYSDSSIISRLFTEDYGKVAIIAKGVWKPNNTNGFTLEPMNHIKIQYYYKTNRQINILKELELIHKSFILRSDWERIILGQSIVEILDKSTFENNKRPILYRLCWRVLDKINSPAQNYWLVFTFYLYQLSLILGFMPNLQTCCKCKTILYNANIDKYTGELICNNCSNNSILSINNNCLIFLQKLETLHLDNVDSLLNDSLEIYHAIHFLILFLCIHIDGMNHVHSFNLVRKLFKNYT